MLSDSSWLGRNDSLGSDEAPFNCIDQSLMVDKCQELSRALEHIYFSLIVEAILWLRFYIRSY